MDTKTARIRALNDQLRQNFADGMAVMTPGVAALGAEARSRADSQLKPREADQAIVRPQGRLLWSVVRGAGFRSAARHSDLNRTAAKRVLERVALGVACMGRE